MNGPGERVRLYTLYERVWHWMQALAVGLLLLSGFEVRGMFRLLGFEGAVRLHEALGFFLLANAFLGLFYFLTSGAIRQYVQAPRDFATLAVRQALYYVRGIFRGEPHPVERTARARLNPLQKVVYVAILNVLLPWQIFTGFLVWGIERWPRVEGWTGGLDVLVPLHALGSWLFLAFLVAHVYLTTTSGPRPLSGIASMVTGWDPVNPPRSARSGSLSRLVRRGGSSRCRGPDTVSSPPPLAPGTSIARSPLARACEIEPDGSGPALARGGALGAPWRLLHRLWKDAPKAPDRPTTEASS